MLRKWLLVQAKGKKQPKTKTGRLMKLLAIKQTDMFVPWNYISISKLANTQKISIHIILKSQFCSLFGH